MRPTATLFYLFLGAAFCLILVELRLYVTGSGSLVTNFSLTTQASASEPALTRDRSQQAIPSAPDPRGEQAQASSAPRQDQAQPAILSALTHPQKVTTNPTPAHPEKLTPGPDPRAEQAISSYPTPNSNFPGLRSVAEQLPLSAVKQKPYTFEKDANGFCRLSGFELNGPLYPKGTTLPGGLRYEDFNQFNGSKDLLGRWHKLKFHAVSNDKIMFLIPPKSGSTSTRNFLSTLGKRTGSKFKLSFDMGTWYKAVQAGTETRPFAEWFFSPEVHGKKHIFTTIREPYARLDSGTGTCLHRMPGCRNQKQKLAEMYESAAFNEAMVHIYPQSYFYSHAPSLTVFTISSSYATQLNRWLAWIFPGQQFSKKMSKGNEREGKAGVDRNMTQLLINNGNHAFLRDYIYDEVLWARAKALGC